MISFSCLFFIQKVINLKIFLTTQDSVEKIDKSYFPDKTFPLELIKYYKKQFSLAKIYLKDVYVKYKIINMKFIAIVTYSDSSENADFNGLISYSYKRFLKIIINYHKKDYIFIQISHLILVKFKQHQKNMNSMRLYQQKKTRVLQISIIHANFSSILEKSVNLMNNHQRQKSRIPAPMKSRRFCLSTH